MRTPGSSSRPQRRPRWSELGGRAKAWRVLHAAWAAVQLACLARVWQSALVPRHRPPAWGSAAILGLEGAALVVGRGNCPVGPRQAEWGDPVPFFELVLPPRAAKAAIPVLALVSLAGISLLVLRQAGEISCGRFRTAGRRRHQAPA